MKRYGVKSRPGRETYLDILHETDAGYKIRLTKQADGSEDVREDYIDRHLFELCVKTGYLYDILPA
jgi:hypothetical protein